MFNEALVRAHGSDGVEHRRINDFDDWFLLLSRCAKLGSGINCTGKFLSSFSHWCIVGNFSSFGCNSVSTDFCLLKERMNSILINS